MSIETLNCPNCAAPLHPQPGQPLTICLYCNSTIRLNLSAAQSTAAVETSIQPEVMEQVRQLMMSGRRAEAAQMYQQKTGTSAQDAQAAVNDLGKQITFSTIQRQQLTPYGIVFVLVSALLLGVSAIGWVTGRLHPLIAVALTGFALLQFAVFGRSLLTTLKFLGARTAPATTLKLAPIGVTKLRDTTVHSFKVLLEVRPETGQPFRAEILLPVRSENLSRAQPGAVIRVKYLPNDPGSVIFDSRLYSK